MGLNWAALPPMTLNALVCIQHVQVDALVVHVLKRLSCVEKTLVEGFVFDAQNIARPGGVEAVNTWEWNRELLYIPKRTSMENNEEKFGSLEQTFLGMRTVLGTFGRPVASSSLDQSILPSRPIQIVIFWQILGQIGIYLMHNVENFAVL